MMDMKAVRNRREDLTRNMEKAAGKDGNRDDSDSGVRSGRKRRGRDGLKQEKQE